MEQFPLDIIEFSLLVFGLFLVFGVFRAKWKLWNWVDILYYPLGAVGILLLFEQNQASRTLFDLNNLKHVREQTIQKLESSKPEVKEFIRDEESITIYGRHFQFISQKANTCKRPYGWDVGCSEMIKAGDVTNKYERLFIGVDTLEEIQELCDSAATVIDRLGEVGALDRYHYTHMKELYIEQVNSVDYIPSFEFIDNKVKGLKTKYKSDNERMFKKGGFDSNSLEGLRKYNRTQSEIMEHFMIGYSVCWDAPKVIKNGSFRKWSESYKNEINKQEANEKRIEQLKESLKTIKPASFFDDFIWPYIIVFALAMKFGKAIASVSGNVPSFRYCATLTIGFVLKPFSGLYRLIQSILTKVFS